jgi:hypothetical protein
MLVKTKHAAQQQERESAQAEPQRIVEEKPYIPHQVADSNTMGHTTPAAGQKEETPQQRHFPRTTARQRQASSQARPVYGTVTGDKQPYTHELNYKHTAADMPRYCQQMQGGSTPVWTQTLQSSAPNGQPAGTQQQHGPNEAKTSNRKQVMQHITGYNLQGPLHKKVVVEQSPARYKVTAGQPPTTGSEEQGDAISQPHRHQHNAGPYEALPNVRERSWYSTAQVCQKQTADATEQQQTKQIGHVPAKPSYPVTYSPIRVQHSQTPNHSQPGSTALTHRLYRVQLHPAVQP